MTNSDKLQWCGATAFISAQVITSLFPLLYPYNIVLFAIGGLSFLVWSIMVGNRPQTVVNIVGLAISLAGLIKALI